MAQRKKTWEQKVTIVKDSFNRAKQDSMFSRKFYENLFFLKPKIKDYFMNTDWSHQEKALMRGLDFLIGFLDKKDNFSRTQIARLSKSHSSFGLKIHPHDYYYWIEALILTTSQCDHLWQKDFGYYWRECASFPITFMISQYFLKED